MREKEFSKLYNQLLLNYNKEFDSDMFEMWYEELVEFDLKYIKQVFRKLMIQNKFMPTLKEVIDELKNVKYEPLTNEEKLEKFKNQGIMPKWVDKEIKNDPMTQEEIDEFNELLKEFK